MRNLRLQGEHQRSVLTTSDDIGPLVAVCRRRYHSGGGENHDEDAFRYSLTNDGVVRKEGLVLDEKNDQASKLAVIWEIRLPHMLTISDTGWFDLILINGQQQHHNDTHHGGGGSEQEQLVALCHSGAIVSIDGTDGAAELVGEFENGIVAAAWSPHNCEFLALITLVTDDDDDDDINKNDAADRDAGTATVAVGSLSPPTQQRRRPKRSVLLCMNSQFDVLEEVTIESISPTDVSFTTLCWSPPSVTPTQIAICSVDDESIPDLMTSTADPSSSLSSSGGANNNNKKKKNDLISRKVRFYRADTLELLALGRNEDGSGSLVPNLQATPMAWGNHSSALLAAIQKKGKRTTQVSFFEPNGLRHREFVLRESDDSNVLFDVQSLAWNNPLGDLLSVTLRCTNENGGVVTKVQLWHRSNYHWYLKYELQFDNSNSETNSVQSVHFDDQDPFRLYVIQSTCWTEYTFQWDDSTVVSGAAVAFSIDGKLLNMTDFDQCFMPPPMYAFTLTMTSPVCEVALSRGGQRESSSTGCLGIGVALLATGGCAILNVGKKSEGATTAVEIKAMVQTPPGPLSSSRLRSPCVLSYGDGRILVSFVTCSSNEPFRDEFVVYSIQWSQLAKSSAATMTRLGSILLEGRCLSAVPWTDCQDGSVLVQLDDGSLWEYEPDYGSAGVVGTVAPSTLLPLMEPCPWMAAIKNPSMLGAAHRDRLLVGKSRKNRFYCQELLLADSISSFTISMDNGYLCYVSSDTRCICRFLPLVDLCSFDPLLGADENHLLEGYEPRLVEEGARLVAVLATKPAMVLQMPRGNIEVNYPRALVLRHVMMDIKNGRYGPAYEAMRRLKVDLNLLVDLDPVHFLDGRGFIDFLDQVVAIDHLNLFISTLQNWNSTAEQIPVPRWIERVDGSPGAETPFDFSTKVNQVCTALRDEMMDAQTRGKCKGGREVSSSHFLLPILSTFAKQDPPRLSDALALIRINAENQTASNQSSSNLTRKATPLLSNEAQESIKYLAFLADYELLFKTALGMYDYEMARAVARNSQMDPKTYLPLLRRYMELPPSYAKYEVDIKLERYDAALRNLAASGDAGEQVGAAAEGQHLLNKFENCLSLVERHGLHALGLELYTEHTKRKQILLSLGNHAMREKMYEFALTVFLSARESTTDNNSLCIDAAKMAKDWRTMFSLTAESEHDSLAREIADALSGSAEGSMNKRTLLQDAARILLDYCHDVGRAVELLISAKLWDEARRVALLHRDTDSSDDVTEAAVSYAYTCIEDFRERETSFEAATKRFGHSIRIRKEAQRNGDEELMVDEAMEQGSQFSLASNASMMSARSTSSRASAVSLSSVISVKSNSSFSVTRDNRHKSKFSNNNNGGQTRKKKQKPGSKKKPRAKVGSDEDLQSIVDLLRGNLISNDYRGSINETILFLLKTDQQQSSARALYDGYQNLSQQVLKSRDDGNQQRHAEFHRNNFDRLRGAAWHDPRELDHRTESEVAQMECPSLAEPLCAFFSAVPPTIGPINPY